jgi:hypothetical protein
LLGGALVERIKEVLQGGLVVRRSTVDVPSFVTQQAWVKFDEIIGLGR